MILDTEKDWLKKVEDLAQQICVREGCFLYDLEFIGLGGGRTLRVFIDKDPGPVGIEECSLVSQGLNLQLDVDDLVPGGPYHLEVSSPGLERKLRCSWHFEKAVGKVVDLRLKEGLGSVGLRGVRNPSLKKLRTIVLEYRDEKIRLEWDGVSGWIPLHEIEKAHLHFEIVKGAKKEF